ncbi:aromatic ring-opening dioxygenase subunit LigB [Sphaerobacter thermophilus]|jgi:aromatic ring-opening dioxygenase LigB subunit|uniref:Extradiol ring-cleavage dioxygenase class III protein subunit B n=1 Tax=Sphaerobacter thermophilus (strain ATCC 49802 / DSM 20745 / KCCM 41009 / NCIMB 13125 / S 6022) TaxID=479434 RepID=D1C6S9_SPHTD|nr:aromatic ring-opening dioxygenase subunit LigB [Sphaerobacter thermophilus]ACZ37690.1 Extradiol ring-cleavage dioxygenase class III protein subunit B [Sphaerobacter thermophilus DSM 20745]PZN63044.1 MAG: aromatic ring-opening dioxygenase subunit LigB [Sphaerobacter thermophilus]
MAGLVFAAVLPHGFPIIPDLSDDAEGALATRAAMEEAGRRCAAAQPDVIVVATPHGTRVDGAICLASVARGAGTLRWEGRQIEMNIPVDGPMTDLIAERARARDIPIAMAGFAGNRRYQSCIPLDWGTITPLWFLGHGRNMVGHGDVLAPAPEDIGPPAVIATPSRLLPRETMIDFGVAIAEAAAQSGRRVAFVASCDWAHTHKESGPYGFHPDAAEVDAKVVAALKDNDPGRLISLTEEEVQNAAIDGLWQTLMLAGAMAHTPMRGEVLSYEAPSYYSMIVATFTPES